MPVSDSVAISSELFDQSCLYIPPGGGRGSEDKDNFGQKARANGNCLNFVAAIWQH
jgi:hypothetical protein